MSFDWVKALAWAWAAVFGLTFWLMVGMVAITVITSCNRSTPTPAPGTAQSAAAGAQARAEAAAHASDAAGTDAARLAGEAAAATARAAATGLADDITAAVDARVRAAAAQAVHTALLAQETTARTAAEDATKAAADERAAEQIAQDYRSWVRQCRVVGGLLILAGFLAAAGLAWATSNPWAGRWPGGILAAAGALIITLGPATAWLPWVVVPAVIIAGIILAVGHRRLDRVSTALSRTVDAAEGKAKVSLAEAKDELHQAVEHSGLRGLLKRKRAAWYTP